MIPTLLINALVGAFIIIFSFSPVYGIAFITAFRTLALLTYVQMGTYYYTGEGFLTLAVIIAGGVYVLINFGQLKALSTKWPFIIFILYSTLTVLNAADTANFSKKIARLIGYLILYLIVARLSADEKKRNILSLGIVISLVVTNLPAVYLYYIAPNGYADRFQGGDALYAIQEVGIMPKNNFGFFSCYMSLFLAYLYVAARSKLSKAFFLSLFVMQAALLVLSFTRSAWAGFAAAVPFFVFFSKNRLRLLMPLVAVAVIGASLYSIVSFGAYGDFTQKKKVGFNSLHFRTALAWPASIKAFEEKPIMGWGLGNDYYALSKAGKLNSTSHNDYLLVLVETGLIGFSLYLWLWASFFRKTIAGIRNAADDQTRLLCVAALAILVSYLVGSAGEHLLQPPGATGAVITVLGLARGTLLAARQNALPASEKDLHFSPVPV